MSFNDGFCAAPVAAGERRIPSTPTSFLSDAAQQALEAPVDSLAVGLEFFPRRVHRAAPRTHRCNTKKSRTDPNDDHSNRLRHHPSVQEGSRRRKADAKRKTEETLA